MKILPITVVMLENEDNYSWFVNPLPQVLEKEKAEYNYDSTLQFTLDSSKNMSVQIAKELELYPLNKTKSVDDIEARLDVYNHLRKELDIGIEMHYTFADENLVEFLHDLY